MKMRLALSAGFDRALHAVALAELLRRRGHCIDPVLVVNQMTLRRVRQVVRQQGFAGLGRQALRFLKGGRIAGRENAPNRLVTFLEEHGIVERSLKQWCRKNHSTYKVLATLNDVSAVGLAASSSLDGLVYAGGGIIHQPLIDAVKGRILNAHSGPLPQIRGMNACEWSLLLGMQPTVTIHFIERGIDTGSSVCALPLQVEQNDTIECLREKCTVLGVEGIVRSIDVLEQPISTSGSAAPTVRQRQCYVLAPILRELLESRLRSGYYFHRLGERSI